MMDAPTFPSAVAWISAWPCPTAVTTPEELTVTTDELVECVSNTRKIDAIYTKDFSELLGIKAVIITAAA